MKQLYFTAFFVFSFLIVQAQQDFRPGYIIKQHGDTLRGEVNFQRPKKMAHACEFRVNNDAAKERYLPGAILGYGFAAGPHFISKVLTDKLPFSKKQKIVNRPYFLNKLVEAPVSLLETRDLSGNPRFFIQKDTVFQELEIRENTVKNEKDGRYYKVKSKLYIGTLTYLLNECPAIRSSLNKTPFKASALTEIVKNYNQCVNPGAQLEVQQVSRPVVKFGVIGGTNASFVTLSAPEFAEEIAQGNVYKPGITAGFTFNSTLPFLSKNLSIQTELTYVRNFFNTNYQYQRYLTTNGVPTTAVNFKLISDIRLDVLELPLQVRYTFHNRKAKPYLNAGILYSFLLKQKDASHVKGYYPTHTTDLPLNGLSSLSRFTFGFVGAGGVLIPLKQGKNLVLEVKYRPESIPHMFGLNSKVTTLHLVTGLQF